MNVELKLWLKDLVTDGIKRIDTISRSAFGGVSRSVADANSALRNMGAAMNGVRATVVNGANAAASAVSGIGDAADDADKKLNKLNKSMKGDGGIFGKYAKGAFWGNMAADAVQAGVREVYGQGKDVLMGGMNAGAMEQQFGVLAGKEKGGELYSELRKYVADSIYGPELYSNARTMLSFGIGADDVMPNMKMLGDVAMGSKEKMDQLTLAFAQTTSAGKLMGQDLLQYVTAGFNPLQVLAEKTGQKYEVLRDKMSEGGISAAMVRQAFVLATSAGGKYYNMVSEMEKTPMGKYQKMLGGIDDAKVNFGIALTPVVNKFLEAVRPMVDGLPRMFAQMEPVVNQITDRFIDLLPTMRELGGSIAGVLAPIGKLLLSDELGQLAKSVGGVTKSMLDLLKPAVEGLAKTMQEGVFPMVNWAAERIKGEIESLKYAWSTMEAWYKQYFPEGVGIKPTREQKMAVEQQMVLGDMKFQAKNIEKGIGRGEWFNKVMGKALGAKDPKLTPGVGGAPAVTPNIEAITGGGKKVINIYLNKPAVEKQIFNVGSMKEAASVSLESFREQYLRTLQGALAAL